LEGRRFLLSLLGTNLERREERLTEEQAQGLYSFDGRDLSVELEELHKRMARIESERATEAVQLSWSVKKIWACFAFGTSLSVRSRLRMY
jgi:hypothetical protein